MYFHYTVREGGIVSLITHVDHLVSTEGLKYVSKIELGDIDVDLRYYRQLLSRRERAVSVRLQFCELKIADCCCGDMYTSPCLSCFSTIDSINQYENDLKWISNEKSDIEELVQVISSLLQLQTTSEFCGARQRCRSM